MFSFIEDFLQNYTRHIKLYDVYKSHETYKSYNIYKLYNL